MNELQRLAQRKERQDLCARLGELVHTKRVDAEEVVKATGASPTTVASWVAGLQIPQTRVAAKLARFLKRFE